MLMIGGGPAWRGTPKPSAIQLYVKDAHSTYQRPLGAGAAVLNELTDQPYGDRGGCVNDAFGIIGTLRRIARRATAPAGFGRVTLSLHPKGVEKVMAFLKQAFDAEKYSALLRPRESFITRRSGSATLCSNRRSSWTVPAHAFCNFLIRT
jgi:hypothetical protein